MTDSRSPEESARWSALIALSEEIRPELHRYCSRLMGSVIEGEDVVQDTLSRAFTGSEELPDESGRRAWLFRVAHNRAIDLLRSRKIRASEPLETISHVVDGTVVDPMEELMRREAIETAVSRFIELPILQRSVIILKDVLDEPLVDIAGLLDLTVESVKAHLSRGRLRLREVNKSEGDRQWKGAQVSPELNHYVTLFNRHDWDGLRALLSSDVRLHQSSHAIRSGSDEVGKFFGAYSRIEGIWLVPAWLEGREVVAVFERRTDPRPGYIMWLEWDQHQICFIRDYRYVRYVAMDAELVLMPDAAGGIG